MTSLAALEAGTTDPDALELFDGLAPIAPEQMLGRWRGSEIVTGHPMNGLLAGFGWYGKEIVDVETVHPLLFEGAEGDVFMVDPRKLPLELAPHVPRQAGPLGRRALSLLRGVVGTSKPRARLRSLEFRGKVSAAMIYDHLPIQDMFRQVAEGVVMGVMDRRDDERRFFFVLRRV